MNDGATICVHCKYDLVTQHHENRSCSAAYIVCPECGRRNYYKRTSYPERMVSEVIESPRFRLWSIILVLCMATPLVLQSIEQRSPPLQGQAANGAAPMWPPIVLVISVILFGVSVILLCQVFFRDRDPDRDISWPIAVFCGLAALCVWSIVAWYLSRG